MPITLSVIKADIGGYVGHSSMHPNVIARAIQLLDNEKNKGTIVDFHVTHCGDDLELIMSHRLGNDSQEIHKLAWDVFVECTNVAKELKLYGAGQDLLTDAFSGNVKGMGPGCAEMTFEERKSEPVIVFAADKTSPGAWNYPLFKMFADPFNTIGLVIDPTMHDGFVFEVHDVFNDKNAKLNTPEEMYDLLCLIGASEHYIIKNVYKKDGTIAATTSTQKVNLLAGRYVGKDDPVMIVRCQSGLPAVGEVLEPFSLPYMVTGWMRGSHWGPFMPVSVNDANPTRFDGPPRVIALGFQVANGMLIGPRDMFADPSYDHVRQKANEIADFIRRHGPFEPQRLPLSEMEYTTLPQVLNKLKDRFK
jgi:fructose 1,6-bisphosphate aldolase/phosphatase|uniref:Fructose-1,6-bisphosphate aldolase/phosphatase n=1 Tax=candidate division WOR-3 bacterium TaxID=2052148 RepID=A0A7V3RGX3_UNCW3